MTYWFLFLLLVCVTNRIGITRIRRSPQWPYEKILHVPLSVLPLWMWPVLWKHEALVGVFRNLPGVVKWVPGRMLPRRWGVRIVGFEIGDRG